MLGDRDSGRTITTSAWATEEAMHNSEGPIHDMRARFAETTGGRPEVQEWEIAVLHRARQAPEARLRVIWGRVTRGGRHNSQTRPASASTGPSATRLTRAASHESATHAQIARSTRR